MVIDKLKEVLKLYQDEPCIWQGVKCSKCKYRQEIDLYDDDGDKVWLCDVLEELSSELEVV